MKKSKVQDVKTQQVETPVAETPLADVDSMVGEMAGQAPDVTQSVIDLEKAKAAEAVPVETPKQGAAPRERKVQFDPAIHEADANGKPVLTEKGRFKKKAGVYGTQNKARTPTQGGRLGGVDPQTGALPQGPAPAVVNAQTAQAITSVKEMALVVLVSDEFAMGEAEKATENALLTAALNHSYPNGMPVNPWVSYAAAVTAGAAARLNKPKTQTWLQRQKVRLYAMYLKMKGGRNATHLNSGPDAIGQNNAGGATGGQA